jgi:hypothetical protein
LSARKKRRRRPAAADVTPDTPIWCPACQEEHPASAFNKESRRYSGLHGICRDAEARARRTREGKAKSAARNKRRWSDAEYRAKSVQWNRARRERIGATADLTKARKRLQAIVYAWKEQGCIDCGYADVRAIEPDHVDPTDKHDNVSRMVTMCASEQRLRDELAKCLPRCIRCHRRVTQQSNPSAMRAAFRLPPSWRRRLEAQDRVDRLKVALGCADCGWDKWARGLDFDHVRGEKLSTISTMIGRGSAWVGVVTELLKCECVRANCHRIRTLERGQYQARSRDDRADGGVA